MKKGIEISNIDGKRIIKGIGYYEPENVRDIREIIKGSAKKFGDNSAFKFKDKSGNITGKTFTELDKDVDCLGTALLSMGMKGSRIAMIGENRYEWGVSYFSVINGVGVAVPLDKHLP